jgi:hypothetical protein
MNCCKCNIELWTGSKEEPHKFYCPVCQASFAITCTKPPQGWLCNRQGGHDGPCAARPYKWQLLIKGNEISAIREENLFGRQSYGWGGLDKIILFSDGIGGNQLNPLTDANINRAVFLANIIVKALNEKDVP